MSYRYVYLHFLSLISFFLFKFFYYLDIPSPSTLVEFLTISICFLFGFTLFYNLKTSFKIHNLKSFSFKRMNEIKENYQHFDLFLTHSLILTVCFYFPCLVLPLPWSIVAVIMFFVVVFRTWSDIYKFNKVYKMFSEDSLLIKL